MNQQQQNKTKYETLDSGNREDFNTGARRDTQEGKTRWDLIPVGPLERLADLYARGAVKYGEHNYQKGIPYKRVWASLLRHAFAWFKGDKTEDHLAAVAFNVFALMYYEDSKNLSSELDDIHTLTPDQKVEQQKAWDSGCTYTSEGITFQKYGNKPMIGTNFYKTIFIYPIDSILRETITNTLVRVKGYKTELSDKGDIYQEYMVESLEDGEIYYVLSRNLIYEKEVKPDDIKVVEMTDGIYYCTDFNTSATPNWRKLDYISKPDVNVHTLDWHFPSHEPVYTHTSWNWESVIGIDIKYKKGDKVKIKNTGKIHNILGILALSMEQIYYLLDNMPDFRYYRQEELEGIENE